MDLKLMADTAVTFLLENVLKSVLDLVHLISDAEDELKQLRDDLEMMKSFLEDSAYKSGKGKVFKTLEKRIREVVYQAEDTIDSCISQAAAERFPNFLSRKRLRLAREVKILREEKVKPVFQDVRSTIASLPISNELDTNTKATVDQIRKIGPSGEKIIVGFQDQAETLIKYLNEESDELEVISIIGMPGLGKTTLAWKIYRDSRIQYEFPTLIWVYVSQEYSRRDIYLTILKKLTQLDMSNKTDDELGQQVYESLEKGKYLLIMDDIWTIEAWKEIEGALPRSNGSGKILITSRNEMVALHANRRREPHQLRFLTPEESWELLQFEVFGKLDECPSELKEIGEIIAKQCGGLPLAIVVIGGILVDKFSTTYDTKNEWKNVRDSVNTYIKDDPLKRMENIISLSYKILPYDLRDCFLYFGMFPEDFEILAWKLIRLWIAEGFIRQKQGKSLEEIAEENLKELIKRNLVMVDKMNTEGEVKTCRIHDMIREFCKTEAAYGEQNLFQEMRKSKEGVFEPPVLEIPKFRRLCIHSCVLDFFRKEPKSSYVRSFWCFSKEAITLPADCIPFVINAFDLLRVFDVNSIKFTKFPIKVNRLVHLRYIALAGDNFKILPEAISNLWNLQTVIIHTLSRTFEIRADISKMMQLRHVKTKAAIILTKKGEGDGGENLQTLDALSIESCKKEVFDNAPHLKTLGIRGQLASLLNATCLKELWYLKKLKLKNDVFPKVERNNPLPGLPRWDAFPPNLRILTLSATYLHWNHMPTLGLLKTLEVLKLKENAFIGECWNAVGGGFCSLEFLHIARTDLRDWTVSGVPFPKLRCVVLKNCEKLKAVPFDLVKTLQTLNMERVTESAVASARKIEQEKQKMQGQHRAKRGGFKLIIAPGDERLN